MSKSPAGKDEWKVILVVILAVIACELAIRYQAQGYVNERHHREMPTIAEELNAKQSPRVLFLGSSLSRWGVREDSVADEFAKDGVKVGGMAKINPDSTVVSQWHYLYDRFFSSKATDTPPDCVVVTFARDFLTDQSPSRARRTALVVAGPRQILEVLRHDVESFDEGADFLASFALSSVAYQENAKDRILGMIVPSYKEEKQRLNRLRRANAFEAQVLAGDPPTYTYARLRRFMERMKESQSEGVFCYMPLPGTQVLDDRLIREIEDHGMTFVDLRSLIVRTKGHYPDNYHMDPNGADIYSRAVADELAKRGLLPLANPRSDGAGR